LKFGSEMLLSIGVSVPSPVDPIRPEYLSETIIPAWHGKSGLERLREKYGVPVYLDNDANLGALAEHWWGDGKNVNDLIFIKYLMELVPVTSLTANCIVVRKV
jgi:predicted NBD/HSP70 family sugar kinase